jgi:hypothetical protein
MSIFIYMGLSNLELENWHCVSACCMWCLEKLENIWKNQFLEN